VLSLLTGGGIGQIVFFLMIFGFSTRLGKPLSFWRRIIPKAARASIARSWKVMTVLAIVSFLGALELAILGYFPLVDDPQTVLWICWTFLLISLLLMVLAFIAAFASDLQNRSSAKVAAE
jgi:RsiW-degrading membrane proteinase PrsW (M82 family)